MSETELLELRLISEGLVLTLNVDKTLPSYLSAYMLERHESYVFLLKNFVEKLQNNKDELCIDR